MAARWLATIMPPILEPVTFTFGGVANTTYKNHDNYPFWPDPEKFDGVVYVRAKSKSLKTERATRTWPERNVSDRNHTREVRNTSIQAMTRGFLLGITGLSSLSR